MSGKSFASDPQINRTYLIYTIDIGQQMISYLKQKLKPYILKFFDAPIEESEASLELKKARKVVSAAQKIARSVGFASTLKFDLYRTTGKMEYSYSFHIGDSWVEDDDKAYELIGDLQTAVFDYERKED